MNHHTVTVSKLKCRSNKEGIGGNRRQFQTGQIVVSLQIIPKPVFLVINVLFHLVTLQYDCFFAYNPIIPADYKSRRRHFLTKCLLRPACQRTPAFTRRKQGFCCNLWKISAYQPENGVPPVPICQLFPIHGSIFQPDPSGDSGQALVRAGLDMGPVNEIRSFFLTGAKSHPCQAVIGNRSFSTPKITRDAAAAMSQTKQVFRSRRASF